MSRPLLAWGWASARRAVSFERAPSSILCLDRKARSFSSLELLCLFAALVNNFRVGRLIDVGAGAGASLCVFDASLSRLARICGVGKFVRRVAFIERRVHLFVDVVLFDCFVRSFASLDIVRARTVSLGMLVVPTFVFECVGVLCLSLGRPW